jgi:hypothetical protein
VPARMYRIEVGKLYPLGYAVSLELNA